MGILGNLQDGVTGSVDNILSTLKNPFANHKPDLFGPDFPEGFVIQESIDGDFSRGERITLRDSNLPKIPFTFGGEQKIVKDYYPGNSEPVTQVLGARETDTVIKGLLKVKKFRNDSGKQQGSLYAAPLAYQEQLDAFRIRGNLCRFTLGEWKRYGYISKTHFEMDQLSRIGYEITLDIVGFNTPVNGKFVNNTKELPFAINKDLIRQTLAIQPAPATMPKSLAGVMNGYISDVASVIAVATNFVDTTLKTAEDVTGSLNRALGLVKNARTNVAIFRRRLGALSLATSNMGQPPSTPQSATKTTAQLHATALRNLYYTLFTMSNMSQISALLARMQSQFEDLIRTVPQARYLVKTGDTLQRISLKYFGTAEQWKTIYDHNKLTSTNLVTGKILEIPRTPGVPASIDPSQSGTVSAPTFGGGSF